MNTSLIDAFEFCRQEERRAGDAPVADFSRLAQETVDASGHMHWSVHGGRNWHGHPQLSLTVRGDVQLVCQRCLQPFRFDIDSTAALVLAQDESVADELEALLEDEDVEVVVGSKALNILDLVEDEALLALPLSPRHQTCPQQLVPPEQLKEEKVSPFAVLKNLKQ